jgi:glutamate 5-kinase
MRTKLEAAQKAASAGITTVLFHGGAGQGSELLATGAFRGTVFPAPRTRLAARKYWLRHAPGATGAIRIDAGAASALRAGKSLLPGGIVGVDGEFARGDLVAIAAVAGGAPVARGLSQYSAAEVRRLAGRHTREIAAILGFSYGDTIVHRDDLVGVEGAP